MKIGAPIFVLFILSLSLQTSGFIEFFPGTICCLDICTDDHNEEEGGCSDVCNPFLSCRCCLYFTASQVDYMTKLVHGQHNPLNGKIEQISPSQVVFLVWHPPKV